MNPEMISNILDKLKQKTGREWTFADLLHLANKLPELKEKGMDAVFAELSDMGLELSDDAKERIAKKMQGGSIEAIEEDIQEVTGPDLHLHNKKPRLKKAKSANGAKRKKSQQGVTLQQISKAIKPARRKKQK